MDRGIDAVAGVALIVAAAALSLSGLASGTFRIPVDGFDASLAEEPLVFAAILGACLAGIAFGAALAGGRLEPGP
jgi:hypothetical protein